MNKLKGFTLVEVSLFLAVTALLFAGIAAGTSTVLSQQQYNDSIQSFYEFMRSIYSQVSNPQSPQKGNSAQLMYGKLVVFGQKKDLNGTSDAPKSMVYVYDVLGDDTITIETKDDTLQKMLKNVNAGVIVKKIKASNKQIQSVSMAPVEKYEPRWQSTIEGKNVNELFKGSFLIARHPTSGVISTLHSESVPEVNKKISELGESCKNKLSSNCNVPAKSFWDSFKAEAVDMYIHNGSGPRQKMRIEKNARNASGVHLYDLD